MSGSNSGMGATVGSQLAQMAQLLDKMQKDMDKSQQIAAKIDKAAQKDQQKQWKELSDLQDNIFSSVDKLTVMKRKIDKTLISGSSGKSA